MKENLGIFRTPNENSYKSWEQIMSNPVKGEISISEPVCPQALNFDQHLTRLEGIIELKKETGLWQDEVSKVIETKEPFFAFRPLSDIHFGAIGVDMKALKEHISDLHNLPIYTAICGDVADMFSPMKHPSGMLGDAITPDDQLSIVRKFFEEYKDRILATTQDPSHVDWVQQTSGVEPQRWLTDNLGIPCLKSGGRFNLKINGIEYKGLLFHEIGKYKSSLNVTNAGKRMLDMMDDVDFVVSGHSHIGAYEKLVKRDKKPVINQMGTFKIDDDFGTRKGLSPKPQVFFPTLLFDTQKKNIEVIEDRDAAKSLIQAYSLNG